MDSSKPKIIKDYNKLSDELKNQIKLVYPQGYSQHLIDFVNNTGYRISALPFETDDKMYLIKMSTKKAIQIVENDPDFDNHSRLLDNVMQKYIKEYGDLEYLFDNSPFDYDGDY
jgi:hypothetical protein